TRIPVPFVATRPITQSPRTSRSNPNRTPVVMLAALKTNRHEGSRSSRSFSWKNHASNSRASRLVRVDGPTVLHTFSSRVQVTDLVVTVLSNGAITALSKDSAANPEDAT